MGDGLLLLYQPYCSDDNGYDDIFNDYKKVDIGIVYHDDILVIA